MPCVALPTSTYPAAERPRGFQNVAFAAASPASIYLPSTSVPSVRSRTNRPNMNVTGTLTQPVVTCQCPAYLTHHSLA